MADPSSYRPQPGQIPDSPGVYRFRDEHRRVIYVGKAKSLRQRLANYFQDLANLHPRTRTMVTTAASVEWTVVSTEVEALQLEYSWIKEYDPRFNVKYRDDKSYPVPRGDDERGVPARAGHARPQEEGRALLRSLRARLGDPRHRRPAASGLPGPHLLRRRLQERRAQTGRPCLLGYIGKCSAPCVGRVSPEEHRELAEDFCDFMAGRTGTYIRRLEKDMTDGRRGDGVRARRPPARRHRGAAAGHGEERRRPRRRHRRRPDRPRRGRAGGRRADLPRARRARARPARLGHRQGRGGHHRRPRRARPPAAVRRGERATPSPRRSSSRAARAPGTACRSGSPSAAGRTCRCASRSAATRRPSWRPSSATPSRRSRCTRPSAPPTSPPARGPGGDRRGPRTWTAPRCASSATTSPTSRATTSSPRWSSSRTDWPARASTGASRSRASRARTTSAPCTR